MEIHEGAQGWRPGSAGLREERDGVNEHTSEWPSVRSFTPSLSSCLPPKAASNPERS